MRLLSKTARQRAEALLVRFVFALFGLLPVDAASAVGGAVGRWIGPRLKVSNVARRNLAQAFPDWDRAAIEATLVRVWDNLGRVAAEFPHIDYLIANRLEIVGIENIHAMRDDGLPGLFFSAHFGNWELGTGAAGLQGLPLTLVYRAANNPWVEDIYRKGRTVSSQAGQIQKGSDGAREIMTVLKGGGHIAMLVDQKMNDGIKVPFFGRDAMTASAVARFALKFKCPVVPTKVERLRGAHFRLIVLPPMDLPDSGDAHADTLDIMTRINAIIEDWVRADPGRWLWLHKRWPDHTKSE
ncbi:lysophospholipid acyltransferase family protein [Magnetospirillum moscoviense]|uniref:lysophospholipid acyltransferase family protein n=1 Tax=Magnetospirillum moscoviense TaxID=1437059 RepID=UPI000AB228CF|nr:lauroyl acyltransferase [Magnetospirillum moscoviense]